MTGPATIRKAIFGRASGDAALLALLGGDSDRIAYGLLPDVRGLVSGTREPILIFSQLAGGEVWSTSAVQVPAEENAGSVSVLLLACAQVESEHDNVQFAGFGSLEQISERAFALFHHYQTVEESRRVKFKVAEPISQTADLDGRLWRCEGWRLQCVFLAYDG